MLDETKPIAAKEIVDDPDQIHHFIQQYVLLKDTSMLMTFKNLIEAINIMGEYGWESVGLSGDSSGNMYALIRNTHYKHKN
ncbi:MAG: hypothetical protein ACFE0Q_00720 [Anaerolineae bacterium]